MTRPHLLKTLFLIASLLMAAECAFGNGIRRTVIFFGSVSDSSDTATIRLTEDLYYSQMLAINTFSVKNQRDTVWSSDLLEEYKDTDSILFHAEIQESNPGWQCTLAAVDMTDGRTSAQTDYYEGYYKILMGAKNSISAVFDKLADGSTDSSSIETVVSVSQQSAIQSITLDQLSGNWQGGPLVTKIVLQRSGRGFVIFKNGATMNITVTISGTTVTARQSGSSNASFFPEIPREAALKAARTASPVQWTFEAVDFNTLIGAKETLVMNDDDADPVSGSIAETWTRQ